MTRHPIRSRARLAVCPAALLVLGAHDPKYDFPPDRRWMSGALGHSPEHSDLIRRGIATTVAIMGARSPDGANSPPAVAIAIVRELQHNTAQRRRSARTLEALSVALGWHPRHLHAVLSGEDPPDHASPASLPVVERLAAIESHQRSIEQRLIDVQSRLGVPPDRSD
jgi:hypothetical protein